MQNEHRLEIIMQKLRNMTSSQFGKEQTCAFCNVVYSLTNNESYRPQSVCADCWPQVRKLEKNMSQQIELPKTSGLFDVTVRDGTIFTAYYNPSTRHWINPDTNMEIGFGDVITPIRSTQEQRITKIAQPLR